jgi:glycosyltransferase involved in cell wall biosynthesis
MPRIAFVVTEDWYFCSHRLPIARAAKDAGYEVWVIAGVNKHGDAIREEGFYLVHLDFQRGRPNIFSDLMLLWKLILTYRKLRPDIVHQVAIKPVLYGSIAAQISGVPLIINALAGLGFLYSADVKGVFRLLQPMVRSGVGMILRNIRGRVIVQSQADYKTLQASMGLRQESLALIRGSGVDMVEYAPTQEPVGPVRVTLVSRLLWEKGVGDLVEAAKLLCDRGVECIITLVGEPDVKNPGAIDEQLLRRWAEAYNVEWWGRRDDIADIWAQSHIACLPSYYREGVPKSLIEAASCGRPIITSNNPGCLELVEDGVNGLVVPARNPAKLAEAIATLVADPELRRRLGSEGRRKVGYGFSQEQVVAQTLGLYVRLRSRDRRPSSRFKA